MKSLSILIAVGLALPSAASAQDQTPESAQAFLASTMKQWGRVSSERLDVHYGVLNVRASANNCSTTFEYLNNGNVVLNWNAAGSVTYKDTRTSNHHHLVKVQRPNGHVQLYFSSDDMARRSLAAAEFLKAYCDPAGGAW